MKNKFFLNILTFCILISIAGFNSQAYAASVKHQYFKAEKEYKELKSNWSKKKYRANWVKCIVLFEKAYKSNPDDPWAPAAMYKSGLLFLELADVSFSKDDVRSGMYIMKKLIKSYPSSRYKYRALDRIKDNTYKLHSSKYKESNKKTASKQTKSTSRPKKQKTLYSSSTSSPGSNKLNEIRFHTHNNRTRIVVDTDHEIKYEFNDLNKDGKNQKPPRIYIDFKNTDLSNKIESSYTIADPQVQNIRVARFDKDTVRLVIDLKTHAKDFKVFSLFKPYRTVIDVWGNGSVTTPSTIKHHPVVSKNLPSTTKESKKADASSLIKQLALGVNKIVIDPGHGGKDYGAPGYYKGSHEKQVTLNLAKMLEKRIKDELGYEVVLTRENDKYISLEQRTDIANSKKADLFISIHTNAARNKNAYGIETYFLNLATDEDSISVAARENATSTKNISDLQTILNDLMRDAKINESSRLATYIQDGITTGLSNKYSHIKNRGVKQAPFYVLLGARMPAVLIEVSFISNPRECKRLDSKKYQEALCNGIMDGIKKYINETSATAVFTPEESNKKG